MIQKIGTYFILFLVLFYVKLSFADSYEEAASKALQNSDKMTTLSTFKELQKNYRQLATVYFHLGEVSCEVMQTTHPLFEYGLLSQYLDEINIYYSNCLHFADKSEIRKYSDFYMIAKNTQEKRVTIEEVQTYVKARMESMKLLTIKADTLYHSFYEMVNQYNQCVTMFYEFCEKYKKIKDAQLLVTVEDIKLLDSLSNKYLYVLNRKDKFQEALAAYPIPHYTPKFRIIPIEMYRLDGLNGSDFTQNNITLWNYEAWIKDFKHQNSTTIEALKIDIENENVLLDKLENQWEKETVFQSNIEPIILNKRLNNRLNKVDYESLLIPLFEFRNMAVNMMAQSKLKINTLQTQENNILPQTLFVSDMQQRLARLTRKKEEVKGRLMPANIVKYKIVIEQYYPSTIDTFLNQEVKKCDALYDQSVQNFSINLTNSDSIYRARKIQLPIECKQNFKPLSNLSLSLLWYDDISQNLLAIYQDKDTLQKRDTLTLVMTDIAGKEVWSNKIFYQSTLVSFIQMDANFVLIGNQKVGEIWNMTTTLLDRNGQHIATTVLESLTSQIALQGIKLNSNVIAISGWETTEKAILPQESTIHHGIYLQINALGDKIKE